MKKDPTVTVIIPTYNRAHLVGRAIESVLRQTYQDFELIIADDGSKDNTEEIIQEFQQKDNRIRYLKHKINKGGNVVRNIGIKHSKGDYIAFLDSDDEWLPEKLERQFKVFENSKNPELGFVSCGTISIKKKSCYIPKKRGYILPNLLKDNKATGSGGSCYLIKKEVFEKTGFFDESEELKLGGSQDTEMWIRIAKIYQFDFVNYCLVKRNIEKVSLGSHKSKNPALRADAILYIITKHQKEYQKHSSAFCKDLLRITKNYLLAEDPEKAKYYIKKAITINPFIIKNYFYFIFTISPNKLYKKLVIFKRKLTRNPNIEIN